MIFVIIINISGSSVIYHTFIKINTIIIIIKTIIISSSIIPSP